MDNFFSRKGSVPSVEPFVQEVGLSRVKVQGQVDRYDWHGLSNLAIIP